LHLSQVEVDDVTHDIGCGSEQVTAEISFAAEDP
jgi:hypothetical protein